MHLRIFIIALLSISSFLLAAQESSDVLSRKVSLNFRNTSIEEILKSIEAEDFAFTYSAEVFDVKKRVTIMAKEETIASILEKLFSGQNMECQQMGNKLLIRKKKVKLNSSSELDTLKNENVSISDRSKSTARNKEFSATTRPNQKPDLSKLATTANNQVEESTEQLEARSEAAYFANERRRTSAFVAKHATYQKKPLLFVPIYLSQPQGLKPMRERFNQSIAPVIELPKVEKTKKQKLPNDDKKFRMHIAPNVGYTAIKERDAIVIGGELVYHPNQTFGIGLAGKGFISDREMDVILNGTFTYSGGYGGLLFETTFFPNSIFHINTSVMFGAGNIVYGHFDTVSSTITKMEDQKSFFVLEPSANIEFNVFKYMRIGFGLSYRDTSNTDLSYLNSGDVILGAKDFEGFNYNAIIKLGIF